uniref:Heterochromatin protein 1-binding protein 3 n=1 Tax=Oreochromis aureus TaxID=47969 RepID=A0A668SV69_OREAU
PAAEKEQAASSAAAADGDEGSAAGKTAPAENGEKADGAAAEKEGEGKEKKELKDGYKYEKSKVKKVKRTIPAWASVTASKKVPVTNFAGTQNKVDNILIEAITSCNDRSGVSYQSVMKYIVKKYPGMELDRKKFLIKKAMKKHLEKGTIKQLKGKGLSGTFTIGKQTPLSKVPAQKQESLGDALPLIITRLCEPKEASYNLIKKYLEQHFPSFNIENRCILKSALVRAVEKGQLEQITGKGARGTFQLKRTGNKVLLKGGTLEDAITAAITAMNEPKTCSTTTLRRYLLDANKDRKEYQLVANLRRTLTKCKVLGWMEQITGHGFNGTYQLSFPFYPRKPQKRPPPKARRPPPTKKSSSASQSKAKGRGRSPRHQLRRQGAGPSAQGQESPPEAPAAKKQATKSGSKRPEPAESSPAEPAVKKGAKSSKQSARKSKRGKY